MEHELEWPLTKRQIILLEVLLSPIAGSVLYFAWKRTHPHAARFANRVSFCIFATFLAAMFTLAMIHPYL